MWKCAPGEVLIRKLFEYVGGRGLARFDFTVGDESFKARFANRVASNHVLHLFRPGLTGRLTQHVLGTKDRLKRHPWLFRRIKAFGQGLVRLGRWLKSAHSRQGAFGCPREGLLALWRKAIYARDVVVVFAGRGQECGDRAADVCFREAMMSDVACLAVHHERLLTPAKLAAVRGQMREGKKLYVIEEAEERRDFAWVSTPTDVRVAPRTGPPRTLPIKEPGTVVIESWAVPSESPYEASADALGRFISAVAQEGKPVWFICQADRSALIDKLERLHLGLRYRIIARRILGVPFCSVDRMDR